MWSSYESRIFFWSSLQQKHIKTDEVRNTSPNSLLDLISGTHQRSTNLPRPLPQFRLPVIPKKYVSTKNLPCVFCDVFLRGFFLFLKTCVCVCVGCWLETGNPTCSSQIPVEGSTRQIRLVYHSLTHLGGSDRCTIRWWSFGEMGRLGRLFFSGDLGSFLLP